jgi:outer membrane protein W
MKRFLLLMLLSGAVVTYVSAQSTCTQTLRTARSTYDQGRLHELPVLLDGCIKSGFTQQERVEAYKLLTLAYIYLEEPKKADEAMLNLLRTDHYFEINEATDPAEFAALYKTFRTNPIYRLGAKIGANASQPNVIESVEANQGTSEYKYRIGFQIHIAADIPLTNSLTFSPELGLMQRSFKYENIVNNQDTTFTTTAIEKQTWLSVPLTLQYTIPKVKFRPYIGLGVQFDYLMSANISVERIRTGFQFLQQETVEFTPQRNKTNLAILASAGARFQLGGGFVVTEVRFAYSTSALNSKETGFQNTELAFKYGYADSIFKINSLSVTAGYVYNIFNPKKLRRKK